MANPDRRRARWRFAGMSLAGQMLALQLAIVLVVLIGVAAVSVANLNAGQRDTEGRRALSVAEYLASSPGIREAAVAQGGLTLTQAASAMGAAKSFSGSARIALLDIDGRVLAWSEPADPATGTRMQRTSAFDGRGWVGAEAGTGDALGMAPVIDATTYATVGIIAVTRSYPSALDNLTASLPNLLTYLGIASLLAVAGSLLLARRLRRQTLGLDAEEITGLVEHREALLSGIKEGVLAVDLTGRITLVNDTAARLLGIAQTSIGQHVRDVDRDGVVAQIFADDAATTDRVLPVGAHLVTVSRMPVISHGRHIGWVATLRDRTEMLELQRELDVNRSITDVLRAQAHEFSNRLHVVNGLIALEEYDDARMYIRQISEAQTDLVASVTDRIAEPAVAALLVAKASQAAERGVRFVIEPSSRLDRLDSALASDVNTVIGNLVDNAFDAASTESLSVAAEFASTATISQEAPGTPEAGGAVVRIEIIGDHDVVVVTVRDSGPGVPEELREDVFVSGVTTKRPSLHHGQGIGLPLVRVVCRGRGGDVRVHNDNGAVFVATLPVTVVSPS